MDRACGGLPGIPGRARRPARGRPGDPARRDRRVVAEQLPGSIAAPLYLRGRAIGLLLAVGAEQTTLDSLAREAATAVYLAESYTDVIALSRRRKPISAAGEIQQNLLPPRVMQISGAALAGNVLPSYDVGGDWFDYAENSDGSWLAVADAAGKGPRAASLAALALGAFRAARRSGADLEQAASAIHQAIAAVSEPGALVTAVIGRWHGPTATFSWINCGHPAPALITTDGEIRALDAPNAGALGALSADPRWIASNVRLTPGQRLILYCDGITNRLASDGTPFGLQGIKKRRRPRPQHLGRRDRQSHRRRRQRRIHRRPKRRRHPDRAHTHRTHQASLTPQASDPRAKLGSLWSSESFRACSG